MKNQQRWSQSGRVPSLCRTLLNLLPQRTTLAALLLIIFFRLVLLFVCFWFLLTIFLYFTSLYQGYQWANHRLWSHHSWTGFRLHFQIAKFKANRNWNRSVLLDFPRGAHRLRCILQLSPRPWSLRCGGQLGQDLQRLLHTSIVTQPGYSQSITPHWGTRYVLYCCCYLIFEHHILFCSLGVAKKMHRPNLLLGILIRSRKFSPSHPTAIPLTATVSQSSQESVCQIVLRWQMSNFVYVVYVIFNFTSTDNYCTC